MAIRADVRFTPKSGHVQGTCPCPLSAKMRTSTCLAANSSNASDQVARMDLPLTRCVPQRDLPLTLRVY